MRWAPPALLVPLLACSHTLKGPCPEISDVSNMGPSDEAVVVKTQYTELEVEGDGFEVLLDGLRDEEARIPEAFLESGNTRVELDVVYADATEIRVGVRIGDPALVAGLWDLVVVNPSGCKDRLSEAVEVLENQFDDSIALTQVIPPFGWTMEPTAVTIVGGGFESTPRAWLSSGELLREFELDQVAFVDPTSLTAVVPEGLPVGLYHLILENPDLGFNQLQDAFTVTEDPPPDVLTVVPEAGETQQDTPVVITGEDFDPAVEVWLFDIDGNSVQAAVDSATPTQIQATFPTNGMGVGAYLVRAQNPDGAWDDHASFVVRNPSAKLGTDGAWAQSAPMNTARVGPGVADFVDPLGRAYVYAVGGSDGSAPLDTVERAATDAFGQLAPWQTLGTRMTIPRAHGAVIELDGWVYAIGGDDGSGPVDTVERARILAGGSDKRPEIVDTVVEPGAGTLAVGTWYYRVSAVMHPSDSENPGGETPASAVVVRVEDEPSSIEILWSSVSGAASYRIYRTDVVDGVSGQEHRIADGNVQTRFLDEGLPAGTEPWVPDGGLGVWELLPQTLPTPWAHGAMVEALDPNGTRYVYLVGGDDGAGPLADVYAMAPNGTWSVAGTLATARVDGMAAVAEFDRAANLGAASPTFLIAMEGDDGGGPTNEVVFAEVLPGGDLGGWTGLNTLNGGGQARMDGVGLAAAGHLYTLGGGGDALAAESGARQAEIQGPFMDMGSWSSSSASGSFDLGRADFGLVQLRATLYAIGGRTEAAAATDSVEQVVF